MTRLILIRHAKSDWSQGLDDHARPLNARGREAAGRIGAWLAAEGHLPDRVLCSTATRAQETSALVWEGADHAPPQSDLHALYHAAPATMLEAAQKAEGAVVAMVAHNPGMAMLAGMLAATRPDHPRFDDYPTGATTVLEFDGPPAAGQGRVVAFMVPRDLD